MKSFCTLGLVLMLSTLAAGSVAAGEPAKETAKSTTPAKPKLYNEAADGSKQIADALVLAKREKKLVLLQFGANWCGWCHKLHKLFESDKEIAAKLKSGYVVVMIDVNEKHNSEINEKYGNPTKHGLPVIVVLDADSKQLTTKNTEELEEGDHHNPEKVKAFLGEWTTRK